MRQLAPPPILLDQLPRISLKNLKAFALLKSDCKTKKIQFCNAGGSLFFEVLVTPFINSVTPYLLFEYSVNGVQIKYKVGLGKVPCNSGNGTMWQMICPITKRFCWKIYLHGNHFISRYAIGNGQYTQHFIHVNQREEFKMVRNLMKAKVKANRKFEPYYMPVYDNNETKTGLSVRIAEKIIKIYSNGF